MIDPRAALTRRPKTIAMVGLGPSANAYWLECAQFNGQIPWEEVWVVNRASSAFKHDLAFNMHDLDELVRAAPNEELRLLKADKPILVPGQWAKFPMAVEYPIEDVLNFVKGCDLLSSTPAYMLAYAMMIGVKEMYLYGFDFHYPNVPHAEKGGQGAAFFLGMCTVLGIKYQIPNTSSLLAANDVVLVTRPGESQPQALRPIYGYAMDGPGPRDPRVPPGSKIERMSPPPGQMSVDLTERAAMPKGAEIGDVPVPASADGQAPVAVPAEAEWSLNR